MMDGIVKNVENKWPTKVMECLMPTVKQSIWNSPSLWQMICFVNGHGQQQ